MSIEQSIIQQARQADLVSYLLARGEPLIKNGKGFSHKVHNSLKITGNMYCWNSKGTKGNSLNFLMDFYNMDFKQAIEELTGEKGGLIPQYVPPIQHDPKELVMPIKADNVKRVWAYLIQTRKINQSIIKMCFDRHLIYQDTFGNVVFRMTNITGEVVGAEIRGTGTTRYTGITEGSKYGYGFNLSIGANCERMIVFESAIDLLSFISLQGIDKLDGRVLVSMAGLKEQTLLDMAKERNIPLDKVCCCVDRDQAGIKFADEINIKHGTNTYLPPVATGCKDWNEILTK